MSQQLIHATTGLPVEFGRTVQAQSGPFAGSWWRLDALVKRDGVWHVSVSRSHRCGRRKVVAPPDVFGLLVREILTLLRRTRNLLVHVWQTIDEGIVMGALALLPLALFEHFHMAEVIVSLMGLGE